MMETSEKQNNRSRKEYWFAHIEAYKFGIESMQSYCRRYGLPYHQFRYWQSKFSEKPADSEESVNENEKSFDKGAVDEIGFSKITFTNSAMFSSAQDNPTETGIELSVGAIKL